MNWRKRQHCRWHVIGHLIEKYELTGLGVELGVKEGRFSTYLLERFKTLEMVGVDLMKPLPEQDLDGFETYNDWNWLAIMAEQGENLENVRDRFSLRVCDTVAASHHFDDESVDFVFIDAEHTYEGVRDDIAAWRPKIRPGGLLCGHDYKAPRWAGVVRAVNEAVPNVQKGHDNVWWTIV